MSDYRNNPTEDPNVKWSINPDGLVEATVICYSCTKEVFAVRMHERAARAAAYAELFEHRGSAQCHAWKAAREAEKQQTLDYHVEPTERAVIKGRTNFKVAPGFNFVMSRSTLRNYHKNKPDRIVYHLLRGDGFFDAHPYNKTVIRVYATACTERLGARGYWIKQNPIFRTYEDMVRAVNSETNLDIELVNIELCLACARKVSE